MIFGADNVLKFLGLLRINLLINKKRLLDQNIHCPAII